MSVRFLRQWKCTKLNHFQHTSDKYLLKRIFEYYICRFFQEHERARAIYRLALDKLPKDKCAELYKHYTAHEKKFGERVGIENVILKKRKLQYEEEIATNPMNYDAWFDYLKLIESKYFKGIILIRITRP